jgi:hypothetical protein
MSVFNTNSIQICQDKAVARATLRRSSQQLQPDRHDQDDEDLIGDLVDDSVVPDPYPEKVIDAAKLFAAGRAGISGEPIQATPDAGSDLGRKLSERAFRRRLTLA